MRKIFTLLLLLAGFTLAAQQYNNEWIQFNQNYYKFKVAVAGVYRIPKATLDAAGIGNTSVEFFELWRNGEKVPFYTPVTNGVLPADGYVEFWGVPNDGKPDKALYRDPVSQHTDKYSLQTDTAVYFLSINTNQSGSKITDVVNNVAANTLPVEPYFMYTTGNYYKNRINQGFAAIVGEYVYSSSYDKGEIWGTGDLTPAATQTTALTNLRPYTGSAPDMTFKFGAVGNALNTRTITALVNSTVVKDTTMDYFNDVNVSLTLPVSLISTGSASVQFKNTSSVATDRMVVSYFEFNYPRLFNFNNLKNFEFSLPARPAGYFLQITSFNMGGKAPILYDLANRERYVGDISTSGMVKFALPGTAVDRKLVLVNADVTNTIAVNSLVSKNFLRFTDASNQGDYIIITHPILYTGTSGNNPVMDYKAYRESVAGGSHKVTVVNIDELVDQFAYGIKKHPLAVRNFIRYARTNFSMPLNYIFLMGRGINYLEYQKNQSKADIEQLNIVPTFGNPASDNMLSSASLTDPVAATPIGRLSAVRGSEIEDYLQKVKEYENVQQTSSNTIEDRGWMKNVVHVTGSSDPYLGSVLCSYMGAYRDIIQDTVFGGNVSTFCKTSTNPVEQLSSGRLDELFAEGISILTYFGHSSSTTLEFNIDDPLKYNNQGKYPVFYVNGCNAGNFFTYNPLRLQVNETLSEKFTLAKEHGSIAFIASTHFGIVNYLNLFLTNLYSVIGSTGYNKSLGQIQSATMRQVMNATGEYDFYSRMHAEEITLQGDPALRLNVQPKPDYVIEDPSVKIEPAFISVAESNFDLSVKVTNLGRGLPDSVRLLIIRQYPDGSTDTIYYNKLKYIQREETINFSVPIVATRDKGQNRIIVTVDPKNEINEVDEFNNSVTKDFIIYQDEVRPAYPYSFAIVNDPAQKLYASTANPFSVQNDYVIEIDTTEQFNSPFKVTRNVTSKGGVIETDPAIGFSDSTVYYWRISYKPLQGSTDYHWNSSSFIYINGPKEGFNQSHFFQHTKSPVERLLIDSIAREWKYGQNTIFIDARNGMYPGAASANSDFAVTVGNNSDIYSACIGQSLVFNVFDPVTFKPWLNIDASRNNLYRFGSAAANCGTAGRQNNFEYSYMTAASRKLMMDFMDSIPVGSYVLVRSFDSDPVKSLSATWRGDTTLYGSNNSLYHKLLAAGFLNIDSVNKPKAWTFLYKKGDPSFTPQYKVSKGISDKILVTGECKTPDTLGFITSPLFGPSRKWDQVLWKGTSKEQPSNDNISINVIGVDAFNNETILYTLDKNTQSLDISTVDVSLYPFMKLQMRNCDSVTLTPYQLSYWRIYYEPAPEGALAANLFFSSKDSLGVGEPLKFGIAFKNISKAKFDSIAVKVNVIDRNNTTHVITVPKQKPIISGDTAIVQFEIDTRNLPGNNTLFVDINPDNDQPEQYHFNNFLYRNFYSQTDNISPTLDVTFDQVHILNRDIVSANPHIQIKLKDNSQYLLLNDTALSTLQVKYPDGSIRTFNYDNDTLRFIPATDGADNTATIDFTPNFVGQSNSSEGDEYELIVKGRDRSGNLAGNLEYRIAFRIISKPMISNFLNYPNPFSTSTAFVFTITGSEVPQNIKIQILTVTGKIVREITKEELGNLHIGRNITDFKWDGTDQYGAKLGNGVYLYRVVTTLNGRPMEKYRAEGDNTDKFFINGYGKMYLMR